MTGKTNHYLINNIILIIKFYDIIHFVSENILSGTLDLML